MFGTPSSLEVLKLPMIICSIVSTWSKMLTILRIVTAFPHAPLHPSLFNERTSSGWGTPTLGFSKLHTYRHKGVFWCSRLRIHPIDRPPEGVPSSLFTFQPTQKIKGEEGSREDSGYADASSGEPLEVGLVEDSELEDVSSLLVEVSIAKNRSPIDVSAAPQVWLVNSQERVGWLTRPRCRSCVRWSNSQYYAVTLYTSETPNPRISFRVPQIRVSQS